MNQYQRGQTVVLIKRKEDSNFKATDENPIWGQGNKYIRGSIADVIPGFDCIVYKVHWENGKFNNYDTDYWELALFDPNIHQPKTDLFGNAKIKLNTAELDKLVIASEAKKEIISVLLQTEKQEKLFKEWGLEDVIEYGKGMTFMFWGPPGTGKTWAAHCIAKSIGTTLLTISAAEIQSSEPGQANRNIQEAFAAAKKDKKVLFLDECDSLIFNREQLGMILGGEVNTLLTEIEKFEGICILATNRVADMDPALERRIALMLEFPEPNQKQREEIWKIMLPKKMPLGPGVTPKFLAKYEMTGGLIKNCLLHAARTALAEDSDSVNKEHFDKAIKRVQESKGKMGTNIINRKINRSS